MPSLADDVRTDFCALHARYEPWIRGYLSRLVGDADAEDLTQDVFERALRAIASQDGRPVDVAAWLYRTATHAAVDWLRSRAVREREDVAVVLRDMASRDEPSPDQDLDRARMRACIFRTLERLSPAQRAVLLFADLRGLSDRETAEALRVSVGAAKIRLHRARHALRLLMERECRMLRDQRDELACEPVRVRRSVTS